MDLNKMAREIHENACAHGWWETERDPAEIIALIHSEWSEALEEYRAGRPMVWYACGEQTNGNGGICNPKDECDCANFGQETECRYRGKKPEGIAVELIDGCIRILDLLVEMQYEIQDLDPSCFDDFSMIVSFPRFITDLHYETAKAYQKRYDIPHGLYIMLLCIVSMVFSWVLANGLNPNQIMMEKHEYNKSRPYRHGGKRC